MSRFAPHIIPGSANLCPPGTLDAVDKDLVLALREYKLKVAKRYRAIPPWRVDRAVADGRLFISPKLDGELWFVARLAGETILCAPNGRVIPDTAGAPPVLAALSARLREAPDGTLIAGELHVAADRGRARVFHVAPALKQAALAPTLRLSAFDLLRFGEDYGRRPYEDRLEVLHRALAPVTGESAPHTADVVPTFAESRESIVHRYNEWVVSGAYEGLVARHDNGQIYKIKPELELDAVVIAWSERLVEGRSEMRELQVAICRDEPLPDRPNARVFQLIGTVGGGFDDALRAQYHQRLSALVAESSFRMANREGTLCRFVRPEIIITVKCSDLMAPDALEATSTRMALTFDGAWSQLRVVPSPSLIHPVYVRERPDKVVSTADVGLEQLRQHISFDEDLAPPPRPARQVGLPPAEVLERKAWKKITKGATAVRKYVAWATHKRDLDPEYPAYVVCFTDFSAGRKDPLQREIKVASTEARLREHIATWVAENVKRGWSEA